MAISCLPVNTLKCLTLRLLACQSLLKSYGSIRNGEPSENLLFSILKSDHKQWLSTLIHRSTFNRRRRRLQPSISAVAQVIAQQIDPDCQEFILDSMPLPICQNIRIPRCKMATHASEWLPSHGYHASHRCYYYGGRRYGYKLQVLLTKIGIPIAVEINSAHRHDTQFLEHLKYMQLSKCQIIADKGYLSLKKSEELFKEKEIRLITPLKTHMKTTISHWNATFSHIRKRTVRRRDRNILLSTV